MSTNESDDIPTPLPPSRFLGKISLYCYLSYVLIAFVLIVFGFGYVKKTDDESFGELFSFVNKSTTKATNTIKTAITEVTLALRKHPFTKNTDIKYPTTEEFDADVNELTDEPDFVYDEEHPYLEYYGLHIPWNPEKKFYYCFDEFDENGFCIHPLPQDVHNVYRRKLDVEDSDMKCKAKSIDTLRGCSISEWNGTADIVYFRCDEIKKATYDCRNKQLGLIFHCSPKVVAAEKNKNLNCEWKKWNEGIYTVLTKDFPSPYCVLNTVGIKKVKKERLGTKRANIEYCLLTNYKSTGKNLTLIRHEKIDNYLSWDYRVHSLHSCENDSEKIILQCGLKIRGGQLVCGLIWD